VSGARRGRAAVVAAAALAVTCARPAVGQLRFRNRPPVVRVDDRRDVPVAPAEIPYHKLTDVADQLVLRALPHAMSVEASERARDVNALDEVPDSTWFTNRIGRRPLTPADVARGPNRDAGPDLSRPLEVRQAKVGGTAVGFVVEDARGTKYLLKFDDPAAPQLETGTDLVVQRLLWAAGYNVPENHVVRIERAQLAVTERSTIRRGGGARRRLLARDVDAALADVARSPDGSYRALASRYLDGVPVGGFAGEGTRPDDPNDTIPHEHRRVLRGLYVFFAWLQYTDVKPGNTLDMWTEDPGRPGHHYLVHYLVDFGKSLGAFTVIARRPADGHAYNVDLGYDVRSLLALGLWRRPWEGTTSPGIPGVAAIDAEHYDPGRWRPHFPWMPFSHADRFDMFWAAKILVRFTPAHIRAAVEQGRFEDPRAAAYLARVLVARQRKTARYWFERVNPLDRFAVELRGVRLRLCFTDLLVAHRLASASTAARTRHAAHSFDFEGRPLGAAATSRRRDGRACAASLPLAATHHGYTIVRLDTWRGDRRLPAVEVHVAADAAGTPRIIGVERR
jgi:hypothetical protein